MPNDAAATLGTENGRGAWRFPARGTLVAKRPRSPRIRKVRTGQEGTDRPIGSDEGSVPRQELPAVLDPNPHRANLQMLSIRK